MYDTSFFIYTTLLIDDKFKFEEPNLAYGNEFKEYCGKNGKEEDKFNVMFSGSIVKDILDGKPDSDSKFNGNLTMVLLLYDKLKLNMSSGKFE